MIIRLIPILIVFALVLVGVNPSIADAKAIKVGILNYGPHPSLNAVVLGFKAGMAKRGYIEGGNIVYNYSHTSFKMSFLSQGLAKIRAGRPDIVMTVTGQVSKPAKRIFADAGVPLVFAAVTDPVTAGLTPSWTKGGANITGTSDRHDMTSVLAFIRKLLPKARTIGIPFNPKDDGDTALINKLGSIAARYGFSIVTTAVEITSNIPTRIQSLVGKVDTIFILPSKLIAPAMPSVIAITQRHKIPVINYAAITTQNHLTLASYTINWSLLGDLTADLAVRILKGKSAVSLAPIKPNADTHQAFISSKRLKALGLTLPTSLADCDCVVK
jgi:putative tryptophan/tyrosine transport system substrate-binding protein